MYYAQMRKFDIANGIGIRSTLFVSGCTHSCPGCFSQIYQDFSYGQKWSLETETLFLDYIKNANVHGVTILGGEPFDQIHDEDLLRLIHRIKAETSHTIWIYSGYTFEQIITNPKRLALLQQCDVLVDGPFIEAKKDITLRFRGSSNQRILDIPKSLASHTATLFNL